MKLMIASDIHGSLYYCEKLIEAYRREKADRLLLLGDLLYHGPRNDLPKGYNPKGVISLLNSCRTELLCVRGNCEAEVDQMVLEFPCLAENLILFSDGHMICATHGHHLERVEPLLHPGDAVLYGHTHIPVLRRNEETGVLTLNPGSVSIPKEGSEHGYLVFEDGLFTHRNLDGKNLGQIAL